MEDIHFLMNFLEGLLLLKNILVPSSFRSVIHFRQKESRNYLISWRHCPKTFNSFWKYVILIGLEKRKTGKICLHFSVTITWELSLQIPLAEEIALICA